MIKQLMCSDLNHPLESAFLFAHDKLRLAAYVKKGKQAQIQKNLYYYHYITQWNETFVSITRCQKRWSNCDNQISET